jgi:hypothetical protein
MMSDTSRRRRQPVDRFEAEVFQVATCGFEEIEKLNALRQTIAVGAAESRLRVKEEVRIRSVKKRSTCRPRFPDKEKPENSRSIPFAKPLVPCRG